jgi:hypothetical protein
MASRAEKPVARTRDLVLKTVGDEVLVYDLTRHRAHSLNRVAAAVWRRCDGTRDAAAIGADLREADGTPVTVEAVRYALAELGRVRLLTTPGGEAGITRRDLVRRLGTAAAVALPVVTSIVAPTAAQAQSQPPPCVAPNCPCGDCLTGPGPGCQVAACQSAICDLDLFCCEQEWDSICIANAAEICGGTLCTAPAGFAAPNTLGPSGRNP